MSDVGACALLCGGFIGSFYLWPEERTFALLCLTDLEKACEWGPRHLDRNNPATFRRRLISFSLFTGVSWVILEYLLSNEAGSETFAGPSAVLHYLFLQQGDALQALKNTVSTVFATIALFSGPIVERGDTLFNINEEIFFLRDVIICPVGEEILFRALLLHLLLPRWSATMSILLSSAFFALSHSHHIFSFAGLEYRFANDVNRNKRVTQRTCWRRAAKKITTIYFCTFTWGLLAGYYYIVVSNKNLLSVILTHALCNFIGPPTFEFLRQPSWWKQIIHGSIYVGGVACWYNIISSMSQTSATPSQ